MPKDGQTDGTEDEKPCDVYLAVINSIHPESRMTVSKWLDSELITAGTDETFSLQSAAEEKKECRWCRALQPWDCHTQSD